MEWTEVFAVLVVSHLAGDFLFQTGWQAEHKHGGLGRDPTARRALLAHVFTYTCAFVPGLVWLASDIGWSVVGIAALIALPHLVQDDGRLLRAYIRGVKRTTVNAGDLIFLLVDQSFHVLVLFAIALLAAS